VPSIPSPDFAKPGVARRLASTFALLLGLTVLAGWLFGWPLLTRMSMSWKPMAVSTAACFVLAGLSLRTNRKTAYSEFILLVALTRGAEIVFGVDLNTSSLGLSWLKPDLSAGQMSMLTAVAFVLFGAG
jgi:hypothetical protein